jgi:sec-independent protein translocase protein TatA
MIANVGDLPYVVIIAVIVLIGGSQLPKIARNLGLAGKEFRKAQKDADEEAQAKEAADAREAALAPKPLGPAAADKPADESITLSPAQLDAMLKAREEQVRREGGGN